MTRFFQNINSASHCLCDVTVNLIKLKIKRLKITVLNQSLDHQIFIFLFKNEKSIHLKCITEWIILKSPSNIQYNIQ
jgi:hypothetical protein